MSDPSPARVGVCSWSLQATRPADLIDRVRATGCDAVQLHLDPLRTGQWSKADTIAALRDNNIAILSGMMTTEGEDYTTLESIAQTGGLRPDETWPANLDIAKGDAELAQSLGIKLVTFHAGFLPHDREDPERTELLERLRTVADIFHAAGIRLGLETGQESADTLTAVLAELDHPAVGVNFDPANMILYAMGDPTHALNTLAPRVLQVHIKDATPTTTPGTWGAEVPAGEGAVDWQGFFAVLAERLPTADLLIEREAGDNRIDDIATARALIERYRSA